VGAILADDGIARAFAGGVIFLDIASAQELLSKIGRLDRIDIQLRNRSDVESVRRRIANALPATAVVDSPAAGALHNEKLSRAFRYNLTALSYIAMFVGVVLIYNTLTIAVLRRRPEIGMLRAMGVSRPVIGSLFLLEAGLFGLTGSIAGIGIGQLMSRSASALVNRTIESLYSKVPLTEGSASGGNYYLKVAAFGVLLSVLSGLAPALRATTVSPVLVLREGAMFVRRRRRTGMLAIFGIGVIAAAAIAAIQPAVFGFPFLGYVAALLLIIGFGLLIPAFSSVLTTVLNKPVQRILPIEGRLAMQSMRSSVGRIVSAVLSLAIAVAMLTSVVTMVASFRDTVIVWINQTLRADLYIRAGSSGSNDWNSPFHAETVNALAGLPSIAAIDRFRGQTVHFNDASIVVGGGEFNVLSQYSDRQFLDGRTAAELAPRMLNQDRVIVSEPFAIKQRLTKGDVVRLPTAEGERPFQIEAVYYDYSNDQGLVVMDRSTYLRLFHDPTVTNIAVYLKPGADAAEAQHQIARMLPDAGLRILTNTDLRKQILRVFDQTFQITYALEVIALIASILGITNTLAALILERRQEFAMLRFIGTDRRQLRRMVVVESGVIGLIGAIVGMLLGLALSVILVFVINKQSFGWTIQFALPAWFFVQSSCAVVAATLVAGFYPASLATRMDAIQGVRAE
jgi:putative ABC transport system permease protein